MRGPLLQFAHHECEPKLVRYYFSLSRNTMFVARIANTKLNLKA